MSLFDERDKIDRSTEGSDADLFRQDPSDIILIIFVSPSCLRPRMELGGNFYSVFKFPRLSKRVPILASFLADLFIVGSYQRHHRYKNLKPHGYVSFGNKKLVAKGSEQPSILLWGKRDPHSNGIADVDLSYNQADEVRAIKPFET